MSNPLQFLQLAQKANNITALLEHLDILKYEKELGALLADVDKLVHDLTTLEQQLLADAKAAGIELPKAGA